MHSVNLLQFCLFALNICIFSKKTLFYPLGFPVTMLDTLFPAHNLNFQWRWRWWDRIQATFLNLFYFTFRSSTNYFGHLVYCLMLILKGIYFERVSNIHNKVEKQESIQIFQVKHAITQPFNRRQLVWQFGKSMSQSM